MQVAFPQFIAYHECIKVSNNNFWFRGSCSPLSPHFDTAKLRGESNAAIASSHSSVCFSSDAEVLGDKKDLGCFTSTRIKQFGEKCIFK